MDESKDKGMAVAEISAVRALNKKMASTTTTRTEPIAISLCTLPIAISIKFAGLNIRASTSTPCACSKGAISANAFSTDCVTALVLAPNCPCTMRNMPGCPLIDAPLIVGAGAWRTTPISRNRTGPSGRCRIIRLANDSILSGDPSN